MYESRRRTGKRKIYYLDAELLRIAVSKDPQIRQFVEAPDLRLLNQSSGTKHP